MTACRPQLDGGCAEGTGTNLVGGQTQCRLVCDGPPKVGRLRCSVHYQWWLQEQHPLLFGCGVVRGEAVGAIRHLGCVGQPSGTLPRKYGIHNDKGTSATTAFVVVEWSNLRSRFAESSNGNGPPVELTSKRMTASCTLRCGGPSTTAVSLLTCWDGWTREAPEV